MDRRTAIKALATIPAIDVEALKRIDSIKVADLGPADVVVVEVQGHITSEMAARLKEYVKAVFPENRVLVCDGDIRIRTVRKLTSRDRSLARS